MSYRKFLWFYFAFLIITGPAVSGQTNSGKSEITKSFLAEIERKAELEAEKKDALLKRRIRKERSSSIESLVQMLASSQYEERYIAASALVGKPDLDLVTFELLSSHQDWRVRSIAASGIAGASLPTASKKALLRELLRDDNNTVRSGATYSIGQLRFDDLSCGILENFSINEPFLLANSASAVGKFGSRGIPFIPALLRLIATENRPFVLENAVAALRRVLGPTLILLFGNSIGSIYLQI